MTSCSSPEPGYPVYAGASVLAGAAVHTMPLRPENGFLPDLAEIPSDVRRAANLMVLNYPNNPTSACASLPFFEQAVEFAREHRILIAQDAAYSELYFDEPPPSILQVEGAGDVCIEFHSLSKTFNMTGWRIGFAVGNRDALAALALVKNNLDSGAFEAIQCAAVDALRGADRPDVREQIAIYRTRRDVLVAGLRAAGVVGRGSACYLLRLGSLSTRTGLGVGGPRASWTRRASWRSQVQGSAPSARDLCGSR